MISEKLLTIYNSFDDMFDALVEREIEISNRAINLLPGLIASIKNIEYPSPISLDGLDTIAKKLTAITQIKAQIKTVIANSNVIITDDITTYGDCIRAIQADGVYGIVGPSSYSGKEFVLQTYIGNTLINDSFWTVASGSNYATINQNGKVFIAPGAMNNDIIVQATYEHNNETDIATKEISVSYDNEIVIEAPSTIVGTQGNVMVKFNTTNITNNCAFAVLSGSEHMGQISSAGTFSIVSDGDVTIQASYMGYTASKVIALDYDANTQTNTVDNGDGSTTTTTTTTETDPTTGEITTETTSTTTNEDGSTSQTTTTTTTAQDGSSTSTSTTVNSDGTSATTTSTTTAPDQSGSTTTTSTTINSDGTSSSGTTTNNEDGSYNSSTTNFDENGNPTNGNNTEGDSNGNVSTQEVTYDASGNTTVTGYEIDTTGNEDGEKNFNGDGVNTEFYAFDVTDGFILDMHFTIDFLNQPANQDENHHHILTMKRANPSPWYGFQLRQSGTNKYIQLGTQFASDSKSTNTTVNPNYTQGGSTLSEYHVQIIYDPSVATNKFIATDKLNGTSILTANKTFPDTNDLKYLKVCIGCAMDANGNPYRYSNIDVINFQLVKLSRIATPTISCDGEQITLSCTTPGVDIYYRLNGTGEYTQYSTPISINSNTTIEAYSKVNDRMTDTVSETCIYTPATLYRPAISCDGTYITLTCASQGSTIHYRLNETGEYSTYSAPIEIGTDTVVEAYATLDLQTSTTVKETCVATPLTAPTITCDGTYVTITAAQGLAIYYRLNETGSYSTYTTPIAIGSDTVVEAYATSSLKTSDITKETCVITPLAAPTMSCDGTYVTITAAQGATIHYRLEQSGPFSVYTEPIAISEETVVEAYATLGLKTSSVYAEAFDVTPVSEPVITCENNTVTITCETTGAVIHYRLGQSGDFETYTEQFVINATTTVEAYATVAAKTSTTTTETCTYILVIAAPVITCDGEYVSITCSTVGSTIYYSIDSGTTYATYIAAFPISATTTVESYAEFSGETSQHTIETCIYNPIVVTDPVITFSNNTVTITCESQGATIYYSTDGGTTYSEYTAPIYVEEDTVFKAYASIGLHNSSVVTQNCIHDYNADYLTLNVLTAGNIYWKAISGLTKTIEYSINGGAWTSITSTVAGVAIPVSQNDKVRLRGSNVTYAKNNKEYSGFDGDTATYNVTGNMHSLLYGDNFANNNSLTNSTFQFCSFFKQSGVVSAENMILPATTLTNYCYRALFSKASHLTVSPALPATTLSQGCYWYMFENCTLLTTAPELPAETVVREAYGNMFTGCSSLNYIKCNATDISATSATTNWVKNVAATGTFVKNENMNSWTTGVNGIPTKWVIENNVENYLTFTAGSNNVQIGMKKSAQSAPSVTIQYSTDKENWTDFTPDITDRYFCTLNTGDKVYLKGNVSAFSNSNGDSNGFISTGQFAASGSVDSLRNFNTTLTERCYKKLFYNCTGLTTAPELPATTLAVGCYDYMFEGCTSLTTAPELPVTNLSTVDGCYSNMFKGCTSLTSAPELPATTLAEFCYMSMFQGCTSLTTAPELPATTLAQYCYQSMFDGCTSLTTAPILHATTLVSGCYLDMFNGCTSLNNIVCLATNIGATQCTQNWVNNVASTGTFVKNENMSSWTVGNNGIPTGWVVEDYVERNYLTFTAGANGVRIGMKKSSSNAKTVTIQYSTNKISWSDFTPTTSNTYFCTLNTGEKVYLKGNVDAFSDAFSLEYSYFISTGKFTASGSVDSLRNFSTTLTKYCYYGLFYNCTNLTSAPELPATTLAERCYRYMFQGCTSLTTAPELLVTTLTVSCYECMFDGCTSLTTAPSVLPATTLASDCYNSMFRNCSSLTTAPELPATTLTTRCYQGMFRNCSSLNYIKCYATDISAYNCTTNWVNGVAATGVFVKNKDMSSWTTGNNGIPTNWEITYSTVRNRNLTTWTYNNNTITTPYSVNQTDGHSSSYAKGTFNFETSVDYLEKQPTYLWFQHADQSAAIYVNDTLVEKHWGGYTSFFVDITDAIQIGTNNIKVALKNNEGNNLAPAEGDFNFNATLGNVKLLSSPYLPAMKYGYDGFHVTSIVTDASATVNIKTTIPSGANITCKIVDDLGVDTWSGSTENIDDNLNVYITKNYIKTGDVVTIKGTNIRVHNNQTVINTIGNFTYTFTYTEPTADAESHYIHVPSSLVGGITDFYIYVEYSSNGRFSLLRSTIEEGQVSNNNHCIGTMEVSMIGPKTIYSETQPSTGDEQTFTTTISNPHLWNGKSDPFLYHITLDIIKDGITLQSYTRDYGLRYYEYVINDSTVVQGETYTGFLLNGRPYQLRGVCMHDDLAGKANALNDADYEQEFAILQELNCNFIRLAHYPHPKEVYDKCDQLGIIVQTEAPCVNKLQSTMPTDYYEHLDGQYTDMVNQHFNHPCIMFWGLSNETKKDDADFGKTKIEHYVSLIKSIDTERLVGYVMSHSTDNPSLYYNDPSNVDWFGCNIYVGWYIDPNSNDPTNRLNTRLNNTLTRLSKPMAFSEYGCGGTQHCHSETPQTTTTRGNYERHDIEYQMWLHEGHLAAIRNFPQLLFTSQWQLFDIAVSKRNEGYTVCLDGETATTDDNLRYLNNKGLVERDHTTKKDTFYLYKAEWNSTQKFVHICGKDYTKKTYRKIKCYTNDGNQLSLYIGNSQTPVETVTVTDHIAVFAATNFSSGDVVRVAGATTEDTFTFE